MSPLTNAQIWSPLPTLHMTKFIFMQVENLQKYQPYIDQEGSSSGNNARAAMLAERRRLSKNEFDITGKRCNENIQMQLDTARCAGVCERQRYKRGASRRAMSPAKRQPKETNFKVRVMVYTIPGGDSPLSANRNRVKSMHIFHTSRRTYKRASDSSCRRHVS